MLLCLLSCLLQHGKMQESSFLSICIFIHSFNHSCMHPSTSNLDVKFSNFQSLQTTMFIFGTQILQVKHLYWRNAFDLYLWPWPLINLYAQHLPLWSYFFIISSPLFIVKVRENLSRVPYHSIALVNKLWNKMLKRFHKTWCNKQDIGKSRNKTWNLHNKQNGGIDKAL